MKILSKLMISVQFEGFQAFLVMWVGQIVSLTGTAMTRFAIIIWAYKLTGSSTTLAFISFFSFVPILLFSPIAGALVDRFPRKILLILSDLGAGLVNAGLLFLLLTGNLEIWHLYPAGFVAGAFESFQFPALSASVTMMVDKTQYARTSAMLGIANSASAIAAPILAGILLTYIDLAGILYIDIATFLIAVSTLLIIYIPQPLKSDKGKSEKNGLANEIIYGVQYIWQRPSLMGLQIVFTLFNLAFSISVVLLAPMILSITNNDELVLGSVQMSLGIGGLIGGFIMTAWGGPKRKVNGILFGMIAIGSIGQIVVGLGNSVTIWILGSFLTMFFGALVKSSSQAIWQIKVPPGLQGRIFSVRRVFGQLTIPLGILLAGFLADQVFEPALMPDGRLAPLLGTIFGTSPGSGIRLIFVLTGLFVMLVGLFGYSFPIVRNIETLLPDHDALTHELT